MHFQVTTVAWLALVLVVILGEPTAVGSEHWIERREFAMVFLVGFDISF